MPARRKIADRQPGFQAFYLDASEIVGVFGAEPHVHPEIDDVQTQLIGEVYERLDIGERLGFFLAEIRSIYADLHCVPSSSVPSQKYVTIHPPVCVQAFRTGRPIHSVLQRCLR